MSIYSEGISHCPRIVKVGLVTTGNFSFSVLLGTTRLYGVNAAFTLHELFDSCSLAGFYGNCQVALISSYILMPLFPAFCIMIDNKLIYYLSFNIHDHDLMMFFCPIKSSIVGNF